MGIQPPTKLVAIACGGTGGHLYPGLAVAESLQEKYACDIVLLISSKEIDQVAAKQSGYPVITLPAVGLQNRNWIGFLRGFYRSYRQAKSEFSHLGPHAGLAMGGFTSAPPILAAKRFGVPVFIHEANSIPGRANRWLAPWVNEAFVYFPQTADRLRQPKTVVTGMPVRKSFQSMDPGSCRMALGLDPERPVLLVMGGSQGASAINQLVMQSLSLLINKAPDLQYCHLTGAADVQLVRAAYREKGCRAVVHPFLTEMEYAIGAATAAVSRAGASSLAEFAAVGLPALLIPYPSAADNHQFHNARIFSESGAARILEQKSASPAHFAQQVIDLVQNPELMRSIRNQLKGWHQEKASELIADRIWHAMVPHAMVETSEQTHNSGFENDKKS